MKKAVAMRWVEALRSGDYTQGEELLYNSADNTYCCLGVLCKLENVPIAYECQSLPRDSDLPSLGLRDSAGRLLGGTSSPTLAAMNDNGYTFDEIADIIQMCWKEL